MSFQRQHGQRRLSGKSSGTTPPTPRVTIGPIGQRLCPVKTLVNQRLGTRDRIGGEILTPQCNRVVGRGRRSGTRKKVFVYVDVWASADARARQQVQKDGRVHRVLNDSLRFGLELAVVGRSWIDTDDVVGRRAGGTVHDEVVHHLAGKGAVLLVHVFDLRLAGHHQTRGHGRQVAGRRSPELGI